jgi:hypothetical protein
LCTPNLPKNQSLHEHFKKSRIRDQL